MAPAAAVADSTATAASLRSSSTLPLTRVTPVASVRTARTLLASTSSTVDHTHQRAEGRSTTTM